MKIIVTGGAGFIGSHLSEALLKLGHQVLVLDNLSNGLLINISQGAQFEKIAIQSPKLLKILKKFQPQAVFHLAAQVDLRLSVKKPLADAKNNLLATLNLLEAAHQSGVEKIIFASSAAVYGRQAPVLTQESAILHPDSPYGIWKLAGENLCDFYQKTHGIKSVILRYSNVYGPRQGLLGEGGVVARFAKRLSKGKRPIIWGDGSQTRDFIFVNDIVEANLAALKNWELSGSFNIATERESSVLELCQQLLQISGQDLKPKFAPLPATDQARSCLNAQLAGRELLWRAQTPLSEGLKQTWLWFKQNYQ